MNLKQIRTRLRELDKQAETIFDREEPVGRPTDLVLPRRRWFGRAPAGSLEAQVLQAAQERAT